MDPTIELQHRIKQQAESIRDYTDDLVSWEEQISAKDRNILQGGAKPQTDLPPVRARTDTAPVATAPSSTESKESILRRDGTNMQSYYKAWDKFDPDAYIESLDKHDQPQTVQPQLKAPVQAAPARAKVVVKGGRSSASSELDRMKDQGALMFTAHDYPKAFSCYQQCLNLAPDTHTQVILHSNSAQCLLFMREYSQAFDAASKALEIDPKHVKSLVRRATAGRSLGKFKKAIDGTPYSDLETAHQLDPANPQIPLEIAKSHKIKSRKVAEIKEAMV